MRTLLQKCIAPPTGWALKLFMGDITPLATLPISIKEALGWRSGAQSLWVSGEHQLEREIQETLA